MLPAAYMPISFIPTGMEQPEWFFNTFCAPTFTIPSSMGELPANKKEGKATYLKTGKKKCTFRKTRIFTLKDGSV